MGKHYVETTTFFQEKVNQKIQEAEEAGDELIDTQTVQDEDGVPRVLLVFER